MEQVGGGVVAHRRVSFEVPDGRLNPGALLRRGAADPQRLVGADPVDVDHLRLAAVPAQRARVGDLAAALGVERALLELDQDLVPSTGAVATTPVLARRSS